MAITLTEKAAKRIGRRHRAARQGHRPAPRRQHHRLFRAGYKLNTRNERNAEDQVFESHGVQVFVDPKSLPYIDGTELDFAREGLNEGFKFQNPNVKDAVADLAA